MRPRTTRAALGACAGALALPLALPGHATLADAAGAPDPASSLSEPRRDPVYPRVGSAGVDALHYDLALDWRRGERELVGLETLTFRAARTADSFQLDLASELAVSAVTLDGVAAAHRHDGDDLVVEQPVTADDTHTLTIAYRGTPRPMKAPTTRSDVETLGFHIQGDGRVWAMQEPYGASTWYAVDDQPADKATYSVAITAPPGWRGVSNGELVSTTTDPATDRVTTSWQLDSPAASYLTTIAIGPYRHRTVPGTATVPRIDVWATKSRVAALARGYRRAGEALAWLEKRLGAYPFSSLGILTVPGSSSGMETQTMVTLGDTRYATSPAVVLHEFAHQWYGDLVTPSTWADVWMNEGMATYLEAVWTSQQPDGETLRSAVAYWTAIDPQLRTEYGPPADFDPRRFASANVYYSAALMWHTLRERLGSKTFWRLVRDWPQSRAYGNAGYDEITTWWSERSGEDLSGFFRRWLLSTRSPTLR